MLKIAAITLLASGLITVVKPDDAIQARQGYFKLVGLEMSVLAGIAKGNIAYDAKTAQSHADNMKTLAAYVHDGFLPEGTSNADMPDITRALPAIWQDMDGYTQKVTDFKIAADNLAAVASNGHGNFAPALGALGGTCKACHDNYRASK